MDIVGCTVLCGGGWVVHSKTFSSIPGFHPLDAGSISPIMTTKMSAEIAKVPWGPELPSVEDQTYADPSA